MSAEPKIVQLNTIRISIQEFVPEFVQKHGEITDFITPKSTPMYEVFDKYAQIKGINATSLSFLWNGLKINGNHTPQMLDIDDEATCIHLKSRVDRYRGLNYGEGYEKMIKICVVDMYGGKRFYEVKKSSALRVVFDTYTQHKGIDASSLLFLLNGEIIDGHKTPKQLKLDDKDKFDCVVTTRDWDYGYESITICIRDMYGEKTFFKLKKSTCMQKVLSTYAQGKGAELSKLRFLSSCGVLIYGHHTPKHLQLDDLEKIDCMHEQVGG